MILKLNFECKPSLQAYPFQNNKRLNTMNGLKNKNLRKQLLNFEIKIVPYYVRCLKTIYKRHVYKRWEINYLFLRDIFNTMSLQEAGDHDSPQVPCLYYLQCILRKDSGVVFLYLLHGLEFTVFLLWDWLPSNASESSRNLLFNL